jgi:CheY-like chemotaxis protein
LNVLLSDTEKMLRRLIGEDIVLEKRLESEFGRVEADPGQMEQMVMNIAINARDAMPDGGTLTVETADVRLDDNATTRHEVNLPPGDYVKLTIRDTGVGMDKATQSMIFEPFFTTKERGKGTGLGLSTVYGIVNQSGGSIRVDSRPEQGTVFEVFLPRVAEAHTPVSTKDQFSERLEGSETVLLVEDDEAVRKLARGILDRYGYRVLEAGNPEEALVVVRGHSGSIDLLLTDVIMPGMSGRELAERVLSSQTDIKILYMSGYTGEAIARHGILEEGVEFIPKPFTPEGIVHKVREVLDAT